MKIKFYKYINFSQVITFSSLLCGEYPIFSLISFKKLVYIHGRFLSEEMRNFQELLVASGF